MSSPTSPAVVFTTHHGPVTYLKLNRPLKLNAIDSALVEAALIAVETAAKRGSRLLVITGEGRAFSAGFDLSDLDQRSDADIVLRFIRIETLLQAIHNAPMTTLALVHGRCIGAAADILCVCDQRVAAPETTFRMPGLRFGAVLGSRRLGNLIGTDQARQMLETSMTIGVDQALALGLVQQCIAQEEWPGYIADQAKNSRLLSAVAQQGMLAALRTRSDDSDLAQLVRSISEPGIVDRIRRYTQSG
jgi:enoyl-CoA hydratase/carnithine racemase